MPRGSITLANWQDPDHTGWSYRHIRELIPTARVRRGERPWSLTDATGVVGELPAQRLLDDDRTDGLIVLHRGEIVLEGYRRGMVADDVHLLQSVSKSITGTLAGVLVQRGLLSTDDLVCDHVPELRGSDFDGATVRDLLDMRAGTKFDETYADPDSDIRASEAQFGWATAPSPTPSAIAYLAQLHNHREHGGRFEYRSILTDLLGLVLERAAETPYADTLGRDLWGPLGAEHDGYVTIDGGGFAVADGGVCVTLRDLARFGRMVADGGVADGRRIVAAEWFEDTLAGADDSREAFAADEHSVDMPGFHYRNQWWVPPDGELLLGLGIHGQFLFVERRSGTVIAMFSTWENSLDSDRYERAIDAFRATAGALSGR